MAFWDQVNQYRTQSQQNSANTPSYVSVGGRQTPVRWSVQPGASREQQYGGGWVYGQKDDGSWAPLYSRRNEANRWTISGDHDNNPTVRGDNWANFAGYGNQNSPYNRVDWGYGGLENNNGYDQMWEFSFDPFGGQDPTAGWTWEPGYQGGMVYGEYDNSPRQGWYRDVEKTRPEWNGETMTGRDETYTAREYGNPYEGWGHTLGYTAGQNPESSWDSFISGVGPLLLGVAGGALGPGLSAAFGGGALGGAGAGAVLGASGSALMGGDPLQGALTGGIGGGAMGYLFGGAPTQNLENAQQGLQYADAGTNFGSPGSMTNGSTMMDAPVYDALPSMDMPMVSEIPTVTPMGNESGFVQPRNMFGMDQTVGSAVPGMQTTSLNTGVMPTYASTIDPVTGAITPYSGPDFSMMTGNLPGEEMEWAGSNTDPLAMQMDSPVTTSDGGAMDMYGAASQPGSSQTIFDTNPTAAQELMKVVENIKKFMPAAGALHSLYNSRQAAKMMEDAMKREQASQFDHREYDQLARDFADPAARMRMLEQNPAYQASQDYLSKEMQRKLAAQGKFSQVGHGGAIANNWSVPMLDVLGNNALKWENQMFGQIKDLTGMNQNPNFQLQGALIPQMYKNNQEAWGDIYDMMKNSGVVEELYNRWFA